VTFFVSDFKALVSPQANSKGPKQTHQRTLHAFDEALKKQLAAISRAQWDANRRFRSDQPNVHSLANLTPIVIGEPSDNPYLALEQGD
jgi:hypothetical protein